jgi:hypothetical protein
MDPRLEELETLKGYHINDNQTHTPLAFTDDLILAATREYAQKLLLHKERHLHSLGLKVAAAKCASFEMTTTIDSWYISDTDLHLGDGAQITSSTVDSALSYLGVYTSPWNGIQHKDLGVRLQGTVHRLRSASLKP